MRGAFFFVLALICGTFAAGAAGQEAHLTILHVNDSHGQTQGVTLGGQQYGGYARLASKVEEIRREVGADHVLLLHAGDEVARGDEMTIATLGAANVSLWNMLGFDAWTPGNGDSYIGPPTLQRRIAEAKFPALTSNVRFRFNKQAIGQESLVRELAGVRIGIIGLCFIRMEHPSALLLAVEEPVDAARRLVPPLRSKSDVVIALNHIGLGDDRALAAKVSGIDLIVGGHTHSTLPRGESVDAPDGQPTLIVQAGDHLRFLGRVDLQLQKQDGAWKIASSRCRLIPLDTSVRQDPAIKAAIARMWPATAPASQPAMVPQ